jgi:hypothetical protein
VAFCAITDAGPAAIEVATGPAGGPRDGGVRVSRTRVTA